MDDKMFSGKEIRTGDTVHGYYVNIDGDYYIVNATYYKTPDGDDISVSGIEMTYHLIYKESLTYNHINK